MSDSVLTSVRHDLNNKIATMDASLSAFRIYVKRLAAPGSIAVTDKKALLQTKDISEDMLTVAMQINALVETLS